MTTVIYITISYVCNQLTFRAGVKAAPYHAALSAEDRYQSQQSWLDGHVHVCCGAAKAWEIVCIHDLYNALWVFTLRCKRWSLPNLCTYYRTDYKRRFPS